MHVQVKDLLPTVAIAVDDEAIALFGNAFRFARSRATVKRWPISASSVSAMSLAVAMSLLGTIRMCTGARGRMSRNAVTRSSR